MAEAYIVAAKRTAGGRRNGRLAGVHPADLGAASVNAVLAHAGIDPAAVEDVIVGCVTQAGEQASHIGRHVVLASHLPQSVPAVTIDRQCGSSQQAVHFAAQAVMSGTQDIVLAAGVESMSRTPMRLAHMTEAGYDQLSATIHERYKVAEFSQFTGAAMIAAKYGYSREQLDRYALGSHLKAIAATNAGAFDAEIVPVTVTLPDGTQLVHERDEGIRFDATYESISSVKLLDPNGVISAANASQICDGSSAVLVVSERALALHNLTPLARIHSMIVTAGDPVVMLEEPLYATEKALKKAGLSLNDIDLFEVNEAFAPIPMAWLEYLHADPELLNVNGGAIALGHPLGASGAKLMATLVHALRARGKRYGLQTMCEGGGLANVTIVEAL
ncbi:acetyl-CoA C-acetyltransferase [Acidocella sp.]|uniref:acetyl-CoA C-acetyltransferase n=1 Tax=Acidocella sp. TaxID=50710 RepID=UPI0026228C4E|nr:acetyl-CoA C-acetyltransferase [Acidocella sp.]